MKTRRRWLLFCRYGLAVFLAVCLVGLVVYFGNGHGGEVSQSTENSEPVSAIEEQAQMVAAEVYGASKEAKEQFAGELIDLYYKVKDYDVAIFCISGGWGKKPLVTNPEGKSWLVGIQAEMTELGYKYYEVDDIRTGNGLIEYLYELKEQLTHYPSKAKELAAEVDFLTRQISGLKVIIIGQSNGAAFAGEVINRLQEDPGVYSIQIGIPFWHRVSKTSRSLVINSNGVGADVLTDRDIVKFIKANLVELFIINHAPAFTPVDWVISRAILVFWPYNIGLGLKAPGHDYMWEYPGVGPVIKEFLVKNFNIN